MKTEDDVWGYVRNFDAEGLEHERNIQFSLVPSEFHVLPPGDWVIGLENVKESEGLAFRAIKHIHQLQNLWQLVTGTELTINP